MKCHQIQIRDETAKKRATTFSMRRRTLCQQMLNSFRCAPCVRCSDMFTNHIEWSRNFLSHKSSAFFFAASVFCVHIGDWIMLKLPHSVMTKRFSEVYFRVDVCVSNHLLRQMHKQATASDHRSPWKLCKYWRARISSLFWQNKNWIMCQYGRTSFESIIIWMHHSRVT